MTQDSVNWRLVEASDGLNLTQNTGMRDSNPYSDHYLLFETSGLTRNSTAAIFSPLFDASLSSSNCFSMQFSLNGANMGSLSVYLLRENEMDFKGKKPLAVLSGNHGPKWIFWTVSLPQDLLQSPFQLAIVAKRGSSYLRYQTLNALIGAERLSTRNSFPHSKLPNPAILATVTKRALCNGHG